MMKRYFAGAFFVLLATVAVIPAPAQAETSNVSSLLTLLQSLMKQVEDLQKQLATLKGDIQEELKDGLHEGMSDEDIKKIQELLATDPTIYPKGLVTGYYGPMTKDAVKAFQKRYQLNETGVVDAETKAYMLEFFKERSNGKFPPGLLRAPGIDKKVRDRLRDRDRDGKYELDCDDKRAAGPFCKNDDDDEDEEDDDDDWRPTTFSSSTAATAIDEADDAIDALIEAIDDVASTTDEDAVEDAEDALDDAKVAYAKAETYYEDELYRAAYDYAVKAEKIAEDALEDLEEAEDDVVTESMVEDAIDDAEAAIANLKTAIAAAILEDAVDNDDIDDAEEALDDAEDALADAKDDLDDEDYEDALESALEAEEIADDAEEALDDAVEAA